MLEQIDQSDIRIFWVTRKALVFAILLGLACFVLITSVVLPQFQKTMDLYDDLQREKPKLESLENKLDELERIAYSPEYAQIEVVQDALPSKKPLLEYLMGLSLVSEETGVIITNFETSPGLVATDAAELEAAGKAAANGVDQMNLDLDLEGDWAQIQDFMLKVEEISPFTTIVSMDIGNSLTSETVDEIPLFQANLSTETYFFTQTIASKIESPLPVISQQENDVLYALASFVPTELPNQTQIRGGGLDDLFQIDPKEIPEAVIEDIEEEAQASDLLQVEEETATPTPTPDTVGDET